MFQLANPTALRRFVTNAPLRSNQHCRKMLNSSFPLDKPSWSVGVLLRRPETDSTTASLTPETPLTKQGIQHLYNLSGLKMPDPVQNKNEYEQVIKDINQLRDFLSHLQRISHITDSRELDKVEPLVRLAEPVYLTAESPTGGLDHEQNQKQHLGTRLLEIAEKSNGSYLIAEERIEEIK